MTEMLSNNPSDVVHMAFAQTIIQGSIRIFQSDTDMKSIVSCDAQAWDQATRIVFNGALREAHETGTSTIQGDCRA